MKIINSTFSIFHRAFLKKRIKKMLLYNIFFGKSFKNNFFLVDTNKKLSFSNYLSLAHPTIFNVPILKKKFFMLLLFKAILNSRKQLTTNFTLHKNSYSQNFAKELLFVLLEINFFFRINTSLIFHYLVLEYDFFLKKFNSKTTLVLNKKTIKKAKNRFHSLRLLKRFSLRLMKRYKKKKPKIQPHVLKNIKLKKRIREERKQMILHKKNLHRALHYKYDKKTQKRIYVRRPHPKHAHRILKKFSIAEAKFRKTSIIWKNRVHEDIYVFFSKLIGVCTKRGLKKKAVKIFMNAFNRVKKELNLKLTNKKILSKIYSRLNPVFVLRKFNLSRRRSVLIPLPLRPEKRISVVARLFANAVRQREGFSFEDKLTDEFKAFFSKYKKPASIKAKNLRIRIALANKDNLRFLKYKKRKKRR